MVSGPQYYEIFETAGGFIAIAWNVQGVTNLRLPVKTASASERALLRHTPAAVQAMPPSHIAAVINAIKNYFDGRETDFSDVTVDLGEQTPFFSSVYETVRKLGWGETTTYGAIAKALDAGPEAARDVGIAMAANPVPLIVPCHRVLAAGGKIGGFSAPGGSSSKAKMLEMEGVVLLVPNKPRPKQMALAL